MYNGSWKIDDLLTFVANTHTASTGAATDADAVPSYLVFEDETASPIISGSMARLGTAHTTGFYSEQITLSAANGFEKGKSYNVYIRAVVAGVAGTMSRNFQVEAEVDANVVSDKTGYSLSTPQSFNMIGNITGTITNVLNVINPVTAGSVTGSVLGNVNGSVASVTAPVTVGTNSDKTGYSLSTPQSFSLIGNVSGTITNVLNVVNPIASVAIVGTVTGSVGSVANPVTVGTNNDKTGYSLSTPQSFNLIGNISGTLSNVLNVVNPVVAGVVTGSVLGNVNGSVGSVTSPVGISTGSFLLALADVVWDEDVDSSHQTAGSAGKKLDDAGSAGDPWSTALPGAYAVGTAGNILYTRMPTGSVTVSDKAGFSLSSPQFVNISGTITNVFNVINPISVGVVTGSVGSVVSPVTVGTNNDKTGYGLATGTLLDAISDKVWDEAIAQHLSAGSTGEKLNSAASAGDPWTTALPGSYVAGSAGHILASRMPTGAVVVGTNQDKTGYSLSSPQNFNLIGNISGTVTTVTNLTNAGSTVISDTDMSTIAGRVWNSQFAPIRTLTTVVGDSIPPANGLDVFAVRGDTFVWDIIGLDLSNLSKIQFSVKKKFTDVDTASLIFVETGTGLMWIDGVAATPANGAITYTQASGTARIRVEAVETAKLDVDQPLYYDVQIIRTTGTIVSSPLQGTFYVTWDSTRATS